MLGLRPGAESGGVRGIREPLQLSRASSFKERLGDQSVAENVAHQRWRLFHGMAVGSLTRLHYTRQQLRRLVLRAAPFAPAAAAEGDATRLARSRR